MGFCKPLVSAQDLLMAPVNTSAVSSTSASVGLVLNWCVHDDP